MRFLNRETLRAGLCAAVLCACGSDDDGEKSTADSSVETADGGGSDAGAGSCKAGDDDVGAIAPPAQEHPGDKDTSILPIVFVHGFAGSASQFDSQAQRLIANDYPPNKLYAYDHDGAGFNVAGYTDGLDAMINAAREKFGTTQVYLMGHSRGTLVSNTYLGNAERAKKVAKVILLDGGDCAPANGVPCLTIKKADLGGQRHVEVATSAESFVRQYKFFFGKDATVSEIKREADRVYVSGRAVNFPANTGRDGTTLKVYEVDEKTGKRLCDKEIASFPIDTSGDWGPLKVNPERHYEMTLTSAESDTVQHFYTQPFLRSTKFVRLLSGGTDSPSRTNSNLGPDHSALTVLRMREWTAADVLKIEEKSEAGDAKVDNVLTKDIALADDRIAIYVQDDKATPKMTTGGPIPYFPMQSFQTGADVYLPASDPPNGVITLTNLPRGDANKPQVLNMPNWASHKHTIMVVFSDFAL